jgi:hypothetical protein
VNENSKDSKKVSAGKNRRWFLALEPIFEAGRKGKRAQAWNVEDELVAVALLGDVTIDLSQTKSTPAEITIEAYALLRDVDVFVKEGDRVELYGTVVRGELHSDVPPGPEKTGGRVIRVHGRAFLGDVTVRIATAHPQIIALAHA